LTPSLLASSTEPLEVRTLCVKVILRHLFNTHNLYISVEVIELEAGFTAFILEQTISGNLFVSNFAIVTGWVDAFNVELFSSHNVDPFKIELCFEVNC